MRLVATVISFFASLTQSLSERVLWPTSRPMSHKKFSHAAANGRMRS